MERKEKKPQDFTWVSSTGRRGGKEELTRGLREGMRERWGVPEHGSRRGRKGRVRVSMLTARKGGLGCRAAGRPSACQQEQDVYTP